MGPQAAAHLGHMSWVLTKEEEMCTVLLPPRVNPIAVNKYININISVS
jgi:hypothetical protein